MGTSAVQFPAIRSLSVRSGYRACYGVQPRGNLPGQASVQRCGLLLLRLGTHSKHGHPFQDTSPGGRPDLSPPGPTAAAAAGNATVERRLRKRSRSTQRGCDAGAPATPRPPRGRAGRSDRTC